MIKTDITTEPRSWNSLCEQFRREFWWQFGTDCHRMWMTIPSQTHSSEDHAWPTWMPEIGISSSGYTVRHPWWVPAETLFGHILFLVTELTESEPDISIHWGLNP